VDSGEVISSVAGTVERVNKLVTVRAIRTRCMEFCTAHLSGLWVLFRYNPEVGDLVVGRITEVLYCQLGPEEQVDVI
jgi:exosome complex component RRP4